MARGRLGGNAPAPRTMRAAPTQSPARRPRCRKPRSRVQWPRFAMFAAVAVAARWRAPRPSPARRWRAFAVPPLRGGANPRSRRAPAGARPAPLVAQGALRAQGLRKALRAPCALGPPRPSAATRPRLPLRGTGPHLTCRGAARAASSALGAAFAPRHP